LTRQVETLFEIVEVNFQGLVRDVGDILGSEDVAMRWSCLSSFGMAIFPVG
jgi:hypothetical protein